ncbi:DUF3800 domain-containing protein [Pseudoblastomonas halimionae]|uniref:DUF3800 domain-containing protein n=1 Tax=Alteriqipengyuania halimionae TaxID=1926630 RepID=A0A6I4U597_9SPHN|nr:DUF3800 domain-containing protein [Alteriqipengyuania halimionae]MXP09612.1 DUF3800 domain-containing protein [Alteriqipengyuania halimionae]
MYLLYCDESNMEERAGDFLLYAGVSIPPENARALAREIEEVRERAGVPRDFLLKFNPVPPELGHADFIALKQAILKKAAEHGARLFAYVVLHDIAKTTGLHEARRNGVNAVLYHFDCYLNRKSGTGLALLDRFTDEGNLIDGHLREKVAIGITGLPYSKEKRLGNLIGVHYSAIGQSHFCSLVDIVVGSLRFAINVHTREQAKLAKSAGIILTLLSPLFFREEGDFASEKVSEIGFQFSPKSVRYEPYREKYLGLHAFLAENGIVSDQSI